MNFRVRRHGTDLGVFPLEELRRRRESRELDGREYVQREGSSDWQPLDLVLQQGYRVAPPPLPGSITANPPNLYLIWGVIGLVVVLCVVALMLFVLGVKRTVTMATQQAQSRYLNAPRPEAMKAATKPVTWMTNTLTAQDAQKRAREFRLRQWVDGYENHGDRNPNCDAEVMEFLQVWVARNYGGDAATNRMSLSAEANKLAMNVNCTDPLVLTVIANETSGNAEAIRRFERALDAFPKSHHEAYPEFYANVILARYLDDDARIAKVDAAALAQLEKCFRDGSFTRDDQQEVAEIFINGWGQSFFSRNADAVCKIVNGAGANYQWLALTLNGNNDIDKAWAARGSGYANSVTQKGWQNFNSHLASARTDLTDAWNLKTNYPLAPTLMMKVSLGDSDITEMRAWFDRAVAGQIDYSGAWSEMRWGLRPRWYGNEDAMLAFGRMALDTGRFDTKVPEQFLDSVYDVEAEIQSPGGHHIFNRADIWPDLQRMYEGYISQTVPYRQHHLEWITAYAIIAYHAGKFDLARTQLETLDWQPQQTVLADWNLDETLWTLEIAARTGPLAKEINAAELLYQNGNTDAVKKKYLALSSNPKADARTREFIRRRLMSLGENLLVTPQSYSAIPPVSTN